MFKSMKVYLKNEKLSQNAGKIEVSSARVMDKSTLSIVTGGRGGGAIILPKKEE